MSLISRAVHGAIIASYYSSPSAPASSSSSSSTATTTLSRTAGTAPGPGEPTFLAPAASNRNATAAMAIRKQSAHEVIAQLPFPVVEWPPMMAQPCPYSTNQHKTERGLVLAHLQIWMDFADPDPDTDTSGAGGGGSPGFLPVDTRTWLPVNVTASSLAAGPAAAAGAATATAGVAAGAAGREEDIVVVFEDDVGIISKDIQAALKAELPAMKTDILYLGWCDGRMAKPVPLCAHAYAITRRAARKLVRLVEPCGAALDEQLVVFGKNGWVTYATTKEVSATRLRLIYKGLFYQKELGSFNLH